MIEPKSAYSRPGGGGGSISSPKSPLHFPPPTGVTGLVLIGQVQGSGLCLSPLPLPAQLNVNCMMQKKVECQEVTTEQQEIAL